MRKPAMEHIDIRREELKELLERAREKCVLGNAR
jgi:hypothetical protein